MKTSVKTVLTLLFVFALASNAAATFPDRPLEGFGSDTVGGLGGEPYVVTSLADSGPGTLRDAVSQSNRYVTFAVGGTIELEETLRITGSAITIDATEAPSPGITITAAHSGVVAALLDLRGASHIIVRNIRVIDAPDTDTGDNLRIWEYAHHIVIDHCSFRRAGDGNVDIVRDAHDITIQWCILADTVKNSLIAERCYNISLHHNLYTLGDERNPQVDDTTFVDFVNNVVGPQNVGGFRSSSVHVKGVWDQVVIEDNDFTSPHPDAQTLLRIDTTFVGGATALVQGNSFSGGRWALVSTGLAAGDDPFVTVDDNTFGGHNRGAVTFQLNSDGLISNNDFTECGIINCIRVQSGSQADVLDNHISNAGPRPDPPTGFYRAGIYLTSQGASVSGNTFDGCGWGACIEIAYGADAAVHDNDITVYAADETEFGILAYGVRRQWQERNR